MYETTIAAPPSTATFALPALPFEPGALAPVISRQTIELHHGKHHRSYVEKLNEILAKHEELAGLALDTLVKRTAGIPGQVQVFNNAGQAWNHHFYWRSLSPDPGTPRNGFRRLLDRDFGGYAAFMAAFTKAATGHVGSGWAWLVIHDGKLRIETTFNADSPLSHGRAPLLAVDVWEHAYYLDYQNRREEHVRAVVEKLLNWEFAEENLLAALGG
jgi:Fe-Mn family superoxide dismutase